MHLPRILKPDLLSGALRAVVASSFLLFGCNDGVITNVILRAGDAGATTDSGADASSYDAGMSGSGGTAGMGGGDGIWMSSDELNQLPVTGASWDSLVSRAQNNEECRLADFVTPFFRINSRQRFAEFVESLVRRQCASAFASPQPI